MLASVDGEAPDAIWCLGDLVGYGAEPSSCRRLIEPRADVCLAGNHDAAALGLVDVDATFGLDAAIAARWTAATITAEDKEFLSGLSPSASRPGVGLHHGSPRDPLWEYVLSGEAAAAALELDPHPVVLVGHSHVALAIGTSAGPMHGGLAPGGTVTELGDGRWVLNPGSVGQPRDGDPRSAWMLLDLDRRTASFRRCEYDIARAQRTIVAEGLPHALAARLAEGT